MRSCPFFKDLALEQWFELLEDDENDDPSSSCFSALSYSCYWFSHYPKINLNLFTQEIDRRHQEGVGPMAPTSWNVLCLRYLADFSLKLAKMTDMGLENWQLHHHHLLLFFFLMIMAQIVAWGQLLLILTSSNEEEPYDELSEGQPGSYQNNHLCDTTRTHRWSSKATLTP